MLRLSYLEPDPDEVLRTPADAIWLPVFEDERPARGLTGALDWRLGCSISALMQAGQLTGKVSEVMLMPLPDWCAARTLMLFGAGSRKRQSLEQAAQSLTAMAEAARGTGQRTMLLQMPVRFACPYDFALEQLAAVLIEQSDASLSFADVVLLEPEVLAKAFLDAHHRHRLIQQSLAIEASATDGSEVAASDTEDAP